MHNISYKVLSNDNRKQWFLHPTGDNTNFHSKIQLNFDEPNSKDFPTYIFDNNYVYKKDYCRGGKAYYYCVNKNIKNIKCPARRIYKDGFLEMPSQKENFFHQSDLCNIQNLEASKQLKNQLYILRLNVRNYYLQNRNKSIRYIHSEFKKCNYSCTISQIEYWLKDLTNQSNGKCSHLKFMKDDLNPTESRLWCRLNDEVNNLMLFMTDLHEDILIDSDVWLIDGTFRTAPRNFNQVINIMAVNTLKKKYITVAHLLINGKKEADYTFSLNTFLTQIVSSFHFLRVEIIICDFEKALMNAIQNSKNNFHLNEQLNRTIKIQGCLFHYSQCLFRTFSKYYSRKNTTKQMKQILYILLYAPYLEWNLLTNWINNLFKKKNNITQFLLYYKKVWIENRYIWHIEDHLADIVYNISI